MADLLDLHVLVVDDEPANVRLLERILRRAGHRRVTATTDPRDALRTLASDRPDLVLLDLHMPHVDGFALMGHVRASGGEAEYLPVLVLTADVTEETKRRALKAGGTDFVTKPFDETEVVLRVRNLLETRSLHLRLRAHNVDLERQVHERDEEARRLADEQARARRAIEDVLAGRLFAPVFQPIVDLATGRVAGVEALTRFRAEPARPPDAWFREAAAAGLGFELEMAAVHAAFEQLAALPSGVYFSVNLAPATLVRADPAALLGGMEPGRVTVEVTEHAAVADYEALHGALAGLREAGVRLAIDDAGAGFSSLQHILELRPDVIKLDIAITRDVDRDPVRRALAAALVMFARDVDAALVAEGIETRDELVTLRDLGVPWGQGYHLARPGPAEDVPAALPWPDGA